MRRTTAACLLAAGLALTGCTVGTQPTPDRTAATTPTVKATTAAATTVAPVNLSATWNPKLDAASLSATKACQITGSTQCLTAMTGSVTTLSSLIDAIDAASARAEYPKTVAEISKLIAAAQAFADDQCPNDPNADVEGSPCYGHAMELSVGLSSLSFVMQTDEANAGVA